MTIGKKIFAVVGLLIIAVLGVQTLTNTKIVSAELERSLTINLNSKAKSTVELLKNLLKSTAADLTVISAHKSIDNYLTLKAFEDGDGMTEASSELELFLGRVFQAKSQYTRMLFSTSEGGVLHMAGGMPVETHPNYNTGAAFKRLENIRVQRKSPVFHQIIHETGRIALLSVAGVLSGDQLEGLVWLYQPIDDVLAALLADASKNNLSVVISYVSGDVVIHSSNVSKSIAIKLAQEQLSDWVSIGQVVSELNWRITVGMEASKAFAVVDNLTMISFGLFIIALLVAAVILIGLIRTITQPLNKAIQMVTEIANGNLNVKIETGHKGEVGQLFRAMNTMQSDLRNRITEEKKVAAKALRIQTALDHVTSNVMVADNENQIIYMNKAVTNMFVAAQVDIQQVLPDFNAELLMGANIALFRQNLLHPQNLHSQHCSEFNLGERTLRLVVDPVKDANSVCLGSVMEWTDRTQEVLVEKEVDMMVNAARHGDLSQRIDEANKNGFFIALTKGINNLVDVNERIINETIEVLSAITHGDLTKTINTQYAGSFDRLKNDVNTTVSKLTQIIGDIKNTSDGVKSASCEISKGNLDLSHRTEQQASSLEATAANMATLTDMVEKNAAHAQQADKLVVAARQHALDGGDVVEQAITAMDNIKDSSKEIVEIISVIDVIAFQTNLLSLNASVEAARAGEQGRGFAVVATEVRSLSMRSASAAKEIKQLIHSNVAKIENGSLLVHESGSALKTIVQSVKMASEIAAKIAADSQEQFKNIQRINGVITQMDESTQQNAALVEEAAVASSAMNEQATGMQELVSFFNIDEPQH